MWRSVDHVHSNLRENVKSYTVDNIFYVSNNVNEEGHYILLITLQDFLTYL
jgi:hypothetical protein